MHKKEDRVRMISGEQRKLVIKSANKVGSIKNLADIVNISYSTMKNYAQENILLPKDIFDKLLKLTRTSKKSMKFKLIRYNWGQQIGGKIGIRTLLKKYPSEMIKWRKLANHNSRLTNMKRIITPELSEKLAEFIGVYLGDGTLTKDFICISGDSRYDISYFRYLSNLIEELFGIEPKIRTEKGKNVLLLRINSVKLCSFLREKYNLKYGDKLKNNSLIPEQILNNKRLSIACLRGLIDTDGCIAKQGNKLCLRFFSANQNLLDQVCILGNRLNVFTFRSGGQAGITREEKLNEYFKIVGSSNLKNIVKFSVWNKRNIFVYQTDLLKYYSTKEFINPHLPFRL